MSIGYRLRGVARTEWSGQREEGGGVGAPDAGSKIESEYEDGRRASFALGVIGIIFIDPRLAIPLLPSPRPSPTVSLELGGRLVRSS